MLEPNLNFFRNQQSSKVEERGISPPKFIETQKEVSQSKMLIESQEKLKENDFERDVIDTAD